MKRRYVWIVPTVMLMVLAGLVAQRLAHVRRAAADDDGAAPTSARVSMQNGHVVLTLDRQTQVHVGIGVATLQAAAAAPQATAPATVLAAQGLVTSRAQYTAAAVALVQTQAAESVDRSEYERLQGLYRNQRNASAKAVEAARGSLQADRAKAQGERQSMALTLASVRQAWGTAVAGWVQTDAVPLESVFQQRTMLVQVTLADPTAGETAPREIALRAPGGTVEARLVSSYPHVDPRIQGLSLLYAAPARDGLAPGLNLSALLPMGARRRGVLVPSDAVLWWNGAAWAYVQTSPTTFTRRAVPTGAALPGGYFAATGFHRGETVVTRGAEALLSEELRGQIQPED